MRVVPLAAFRYNPRAGSQFAGPAENEGANATPQIALRGSVAIGLRIGIGYDSHRLGDGGPLRLGGVDVAHDRHLIGHSDADVLLHAVTDALLGAAALGDIGQLFPDDDPANRGRDSAEMLRAAAEATARAGYRIVNLDCVVLAQRPKLAPHREAIRRRIAEILGIAPQQVGMKAKTGEGVGEVGTEQALVAQCVALLETHQNES